MTKFVETSFMAGRTVNGEIMTMPRKGFGLRPIVIVAPVDRIIYTALVRTIADDLPEPSRGDGKYLRHKSFGLDGAHAYVVDLDIASCYEYIEHDVLQEELLIRSMNLQVTEGVIRYLGELAGRARGLPQLQEPSDRLADAYLSRLDRRLSRDGNAVSRYADDIRVCASDWGHANQIVEDAAEYAREIGLILSSQKTAIYKTGTLIERQQGEAKSLNDRFLDTKRSMTKIINVAVGGGGYDRQEWRQEEVEPEAMEAIYATFLGVIQEWLRSAKTQPPNKSDEGPSQSLLPAALGILGTSNERLSDDILNDIVFHNPQRMEQVCAYVSDRAINFQEDSWQTVQSLIGIERQSPWAKLWLLHAIEQVWNAIGGTPDPVREWVRRRLFDRHEVVRAQAAWVRALDDALTTGEVMELYRRASLMTQPAICAAATLQSGISRDVYGSIVNDNSLNWEASKWSEVAE
ncbi:RNA-directed DNA polymerase [Actinomadura spongiicola]|uniref:RNA-directed DNA polymerase n=2 Tax=Actinomadura spongiicola TaxID=2303421 RepID=A0A372GBX8_9ACTN|nr:RNA-directed DNA polymerase [Actinomadura spongiicola]